MNELVERLTKPQPVETARPEKTAKALKECVDRDYVHVMFKKTGNSNEDIGTPDREGVPMNPSK
jgi:hypothetical protein